MDQSQPPAAASHRPSLPRWLAAVPVVGVTAIGFVAGHSGVSPAVALAGARHRASPTTSQAPAAPSPRPPTTVAAPLPPPPAPPAVPATRAPVPTTAPPAPVRAPATTSAGPGWGCGAALSWLERYSAPGFRFECPGDALGHQAMTCVDVSGVCPGQRVITIAIACPAAYMNEAHNSWVLTGLTPGRLDPYGSCP